MVVCKFFQQGSCRYGQSCRFEHIYDSKYSYRAPQSQHDTHSNNVFSNRTRQGGTNDAGASLFRSAVQSTSVFNNPASNSMFGQNPASRVSVFNRLGPPQNSSTFQNSQAKSIFAQANQNVFSQSQANQNAFGQSQSNQNAFGQSQANQNVFGQSQANPNAFGQTHANQNVFGQSQLNIQPNVFQSHNQEAAKSIFAQASQNVFGPANGTVFNQPQTAANVFASAASSLQHNQQNSSPFSTTGNVFQISEKQTPNVFAPSVFDNNTDLNEGIYSKLEELSQADIEAFESTDFKLGFIPELPPPRSLCV